MTNLPAPPQDARRIAKLARSDRAAAEKALAGLSVEEQVALVCDTAVGGRAELPGMLPAPEQVIPRVPQMRTRGSRMFGFAAAQSAATMARRTAFMGLILPSASITTQPASTERSLETPTISRPTGYSGCITRPAKADQSREARRGVRVLGYSELAHAASD